MKISSFIYDLGLEFFKRCTSRKLWTFLITVGVAWIGLERGVNHLYMLNPIQGGVYGTMFLAVMGVIGALCAKYMGIETKFSSSINVSGGHSSSSHYEKTENIQEIIEHYEEMYKDDPSYRPSSTISDL